MILAAIVTYNPDISRLEKNINAIVNQVEKIIIIDNNSRNIKEIEEYFSNKKIKILKNLENLGIAAALNKGIEYSRRKNYRYILTLDQDSISTINMVKNLKIGFSNKSNIAIVSPTIYDLNMKKISTKQTVKEFEEVEVTITSGSLCCVSALEKVGMFEEQLFIDCVDFEICLRLRREGYKILLSQKATLNHEVGKSCIENILGLKFIITNHSPFRCYYIFRNSIYVNNKYNKKNSKKWVKENLKLFKKLLGILIWEKNRKQKLGEIFRGIMDGFKLDDFKYSSK